MSSPESLADALLCVCCRRRLQLPATFRCGHAVCSRHISLSTARCPLPACRAAASRPPVQNIRIPPHVIFEVAEAPPPLPLLVSASSRDVALNKILDLAAETERRLADPAPVLDDEDDDNDRPRKRRRQEDEPDLLAHLRAQATLHRTVSPDDPLPDDPRREAILAEFGKELCQELSCDICANVFYEPVTTPCQHTFCAKCLQRSLDHQSRCPLCREDLPGYSYFQDHPMNQTIYKIILEAFPAVYKARQEAIEQEERDFQLDTPIFVCQLRFPGMPTCMHFFEPRYRLMLRRCLNSHQPRFGMVMPPKPDSPSPLTDFGTMLEIRSVRMLADGRSLVDTWGTFRFRILERGSLDGYTVGKIERIDDYPDNLIESIDSSPEPLAPPLNPSPPLPPTPSSSKQQVDASSSTPSRTISPTPPQRPAPSAVPPPPILPASILSSATSRRPSNAELMEICRTFLTRLQRGTAPWFVQRLTNRVGEMPSDPALFSFWVATLLPIDEFEKARLLPIRSPRMRLLLVVHWIEQLNSQWYVRLVFLIGYIRWCLWEVVECVIDLILWVVGWVVHAGVGGIEPDGLARNALLRSTLSGSAFPAFLLALAMWWAV